MEFNINTFIVCGFIILVLGVVIGLIFPVVSNYIIYFDIVLIAIMLLVVAYSITKSYLNIWSYGKLSFTLEKFSFKPKDIVTGKIKLELKKPIQILESSVALVGKMLSGGKHPQEHVVYTKDFPLQLMPAYTSGITEVNFSLTIPGDLFMPYLRDASVFGKIGKVINTAEEWLIKTPRWYVYVTIQIKEADITFHEEHFIEIIPDMPTIFAK
jgi:hypothetical protein